MKQEASGWPENVKTEEDKQQFIKYYYEHEHWILKKMCFLELLQNYV